MRRVLTPALVIVIAVTVSACGGSDGPSADDRAFGAVISDESSHIADNVREIFSCGDDLDCLAEAGPPARTQADSSIAAVEAGVEPIRGTCYGDAGEEYLRFFRAFKAVAISAEQRDADGVNQANARLNSLSTAAATKVSECAGGDNEGVNVAVDVQKVSQEINQIGTRLSACADFTCVSEEAVQLEDATGRGIALLDQAAALNDRPCIKEWAAAYRRAMSAYSEGAMALQENDIEGATPRFEEGRGLEADALSALSACSP